LFEAFPDLRCGIETIDLDGLWSLEAVDQGLVGEALSLCIYGDLFSDLVESSASHDDVWMWVLLFSFD